MSLEIDAALGGWWEVLGDMIRQSGQEDSSGLRRALASCIARDDYATFHRMMPISRERFAELRQEDRL